MFGFVAAWTINPNPMGAVDIAGTDHADFAGTHASGSLQLNHGPDLPRNVRLDRIDLLIGNGFDRLRLSGSTAPSTQSTNLAQGMMRHRSHEFIFNTPFEHSDNTTDPLVDFIPTESRLNHLLADVLECQRHKLRDPTSTIETPQRFERMSDRIVFLRSVDHSCCSNHPQIADTRGSVH